MLYVIRGEYASTGYEPYQNPAVTLELKKPAQNTIGQPMTLYGLRAAISTPMLTGPLPQTPVRTGKHAHRILLLLACFVVAGVIGASTGLGLSVILHRWKHRPVQHETRTRGNDGEPRPGQATRSITAAVAETIHALADNVRARRRFSTSSRRPARRTTIGSRPENWKFPCLSASMASCISFSSSLLMLYAVIGIILLSVCLLGVHCGQRIFIRINEKCAFVARAIIYINWCEYVMVRFWPRIKSR